MSTPAESAITANPVAAAAAPATAATVLIDTPTKKHLSYSEISVQQRGDRILVITFNRPAVSNALSRRGYYELIRALRDATLNDAITTIVLTGADGCFTAGNDLVQLSQYPDVNAYFHSSNYVLRVLVKSFVYCPKVLVALVDGACVGIGFVLAALCDVVYCTERAFFEAPFTRLGICPEGCATYLLPQLFGRVKASELLLFGTRLNAEDALRFNFVARIVPVAALVDELWPQLLQWANFPVESLRATKRLLRRAELEQLLLALEAECQEVKPLRLGETFQRAIEAFMERKKRGGSDENKSKL